MSLSHGTISRRYDQGLESIVRLVTQLEDRIEDLSALHVSKPQRSIRSMAAEIKRLQQAFDNKATQLVEAQQLNQLLQARIRELEKTLDVSPQVEVVIGRDSHNSNQPPSLDLPWKKPKRTRSLRKQSGLKVGGQLGHLGVTLHQVAVPKQFPTTVKAPVQYGASVLSRALYLHLYQLLPVARTQEAMRDLFGCDISQASIQRAARLCSDKLVRCEQRIKAAIRGSAVIGADETGIRINGTMSWVHVARTDTLTHLASHTHRGKAAFEAIGILNQFKGTLVRYGWFSYKWYQQCQHSLCNAHLLRDLTFIGEAEPFHEPWTTALAKLLIEIKDSVEKARNSSQTKLESALQTDFISRYDVLIAQAEEAVRGSPKLKSVGLTAGNLLNRFIKSKSEVLRFMTDFAVPFDNNGSERDLRMLKLQQKIAGCFRTTEGVQTFCRVRSYLSSARKQGKGLLTSIEQALKGKPIALTI